MISGSKKTAGICLGKKHLRGVGGKMNGWVGWVNDKEDGFEQKVLHITLNPQLETQLTIIESVALGAISTSRPLMEISISFLDSAIMSLHHTANPLMKTSVYK